MLCMNRRPSIALVGIAVLSSLTVTALAVAPDAPSQETADAPGRELFADPAFARGFVLTAASHPAPKVELGVLRISNAPEDASPAWRMPQWASRELLQPGGCADLGGGKWSAENRAKRVVVERLADGRTGLRLEVRGDFEYDGHLRAEGEAWPHLLIEQRFEEPIVPKNCKTLSFSVEARIDRKSVV